MVCRRDRWNALLRLSAWLWLVRRSNDRSSGLRLVRRSNYRNLLLRLIYISGTILTERNNRRSLRILGKSSVFYYFWAWCLGRGVSGCCSTLLLDSPLLVSLLVTLSPLNFQIQNTVVAATPQPNTPPMIAFFLSIIHTLLLTGVLHEI